MVAVVKNSQRAYACGMIEPLAEVTAVVLGIMQDGSLPHIGCRCSRCRAALTDPARRQFAACLAVIDRRAPQTAVWLIDATPDITWQLALLGSDLGPHPRRPDRLRQPDGVFLTHAHMGHTAGLVQFGPEALAAAGLPVFASPALVALLEQTPLWRPLLAGLRLCPFPGGQTLSLADDLQLTAVPVPHRDEWGVGTFAYFIRGPQRTLLYLPDIDSWEEWAEASAWLAQADIALVDGSFYSTDELGGRAPVAHPLVPDTLARFAGVPGRLLFTHLNHTNPLLDQDSAARRHVLDSGAEVAVQGLTFAL